MTYIIQIAEAQSLNTEFQVDPELKIDLHYSLGQCYEVSDNLTLAMKNFEQASSLSREIQDHKRAADNDIEHGNMLR